MKNQTLMKRFVNFIFSRKLITILLMLFQAVSLTLLFIFLQSKFAVVYVALIILSGGIVYHIINKNYNPAFKLAWVIPILLFPIFGGLIYVFFQAQLGIRMFKKVLADKIKQTSEYLKQDEDIIDELKEKDPYICNLALYLNNYGGYPTYKNSTVTYYESGENEFPDILNELEKAQHFIFMEYFIINEGKMWDDILDLLKRKVTEGVDVRVIYDGMGSELTLPDDYEKKLRSYGIKCNIFNKLKPFLSTSQNNRDHRKILVIDGHTAFTGGINIGDEYINLIERFGYWKDNAVMVKGDAVWNFTIMFLQIWELIDNSNNDYLLYTPHSHHMEEFESDGYVIPFGDNPIDNENVGECVYLNIINTAKKYVYITTPYLILDDRLFIALTFAAKRGVDVRIIVPKIPDKWYIMLISQSFFKDLIASGVKIYRYIPGFIHAKTFLADDEISVCGSINLDYRSLYLHFECATLMYKCSCLTEIKKDFEEIMQQSHIVTIAEAEEIGFFNGLITTFLRLISPLL